MGTDYYEILGISKTASEEEIKAAYKSLAKKYHPDVNTGNAYYEEKFKKINEAYQVLSDASKKFFYDIKLENALKPHQAQAPPSQPKATFKKKTKIEEAKEKVIQKKVILFTVGGIMFIVLGGIGLYFFMNNYTSRLRVQEGIELESHQNFLEALNKYTEATKYQKENAEAHMRRGLLRSKFLNDYAGGVADLNLAITYTKEPDAHLFYHRASLYMLLEKYNEALKDLNQSIGIKPAFDSAYYVKGEIMNHIQKNYDEALLQYGKALEINPRYGDAHAGKGISYLNMKAYDMAIKNLDKAISINKNKGEWYYYRGQSHLQKNRKNLACRDFKTSFSKGYQKAIGKINRYCR